ncbi:hypothetical protein D3C86_2228650 [compost metagenome]
MVVLRHLVTLAVQLEGAVGQAIAKAADGRAEIHAAVLLVTLHVVEAEHDVGGLAVFVRHAQ